MPLRLFVGLTLLAFFTARAEGPAPPPSAPPGAELAGRIAASVQSFVERASAREGGTFHVVDDVTGERLALEFVRVGIVGAGGVWWIHDPGRPAGQHDHFACATFRPPHAPVGMLYDLDFEVAMHGADPEVVAVRVHRVPKKVGDSWTFESRFRNADAGYTKLP